jgi:hypothetical protein
VALVIQALKEILVVLDLKVTQRLLEIQAIMV